MYLTFQISKVQTEVMLDMVTAWIAKSTENPKEVNAKALLYCGQASEVKLEFTLIKIVYILGHHFS